MYIVKMLPFALVGFFLFLIVLILPICLYYFYSQRNFSYWKKRNIHYIKPTPIVGNMLAAFSLQKPMGPLLEEMYNSTDEDYMGIFCLDRPLLLVRSPKLVKAILQKDFSYFADRTMVTPPDDFLISNMLFFKKGPMWKVIRSKMSPVFTSGKLKSMFPLMLTESQKLNAYIEKLCNKPNVEAKEVASKYSTNAIAGCAFGVDAKCFDSENAEFRQIGRRIFGFSMVNALRQLGPFMMPGIVQLLRLRFVDSKILARLEEIFTHVLTIRRQQNTTAKRDLVDLLLEQMLLEDSPLSDRMLMSQALQFFMAGFETVGATTSFAMYELSVNPDIQEKLRIEVQETIEMNNGLTYDGVNEMKYLDMCICETLRKYPVVPFLDRECQTEYRVPGTDFVIEKGMGIYFSMFGLHYDPKYFPNPNKFDPTRFEDKNALNKEGLFYIPFGEGPRICIGARFGMITVKTAIASMLSKYKIKRSSKTPDKIEFETRSFLMQSTVGIPVEFEKI